MNAKKVLSDTNNFKLHLKQENLRLSYIGNERATLFYSLVLSLLDTIKRCP